MKKLILALCLVSGSSAFAFLGYPPRAEMNEVTIQKVSDMITAKGQIRRFSIQTVKMNNKYRLTTPAGCEYMASVVWGEFGWPDVQNVKVKALNGCN